MPAKPFFFLQFIIGLYSVVVFTGFCFLSANTFLGRLTHVSFGTILHPHFAVSFESVREFLKSLYLLTDVFFWSTLLVFLPTICMGASFPLLSSLALARPDREAQTIGRVYFLNITGNVLGGLITGLILLPRIGTEKTLLAFAMIGMMALLGVKKIGAKKFMASRRWMMTILVILSSALVFPASGEIYETIHIDPPYKNTETYFQEGRDGVVITFQHDEWVRNYINGLQHGGRPVYSFIAETVEAITYAPKVEKVLVIGFGTGTITETLLKTCDVNSVTLVELNRTLIKNLSKISLFQNLLTDRRVKLIHDDGRRFLARTNQQFDLILIDPLRSTTAYSNNLYSFEFNQMVQKHLKPGGVFMIWMDERRVIPKTVAAVFKQVRMYSYFCLASDQPFQRHDVRRNRWLETYSLEDRRNITAKIIYLGAKPYIENLTEKYKLNRDWNPVCEYYLGLKIKEKLFIQN